MMGGVSRDLSGGLLERGDFVRGSSSVFGQYFAALVPSANQIFSPSVVRLALVGVSSFVRVGRFRWGTHGKVVRNFLNPIGFFSDPFGFGFRTRRLNGAAQGDLVIHNIDVDLPLRRLRVADGVAAARVPVMFALAFVLARSFEFVAVSLQAATPKMTTASAVKSNSLVFMFSLSCSEQVLDQNESPASPFAGDSIAEIFNSLADFPPGLAYVFLNLSFKPLLLSTSLQVTVAG